MRFFGNKALRRFTKKDGSVDWTAAWQGYDAHIAGIKNRLTSGWLELTEAEELHDQRILRVTQRSKRELILELDHARLDFSNVKFAWLPSTLVGGIWGFSELSLDDSGAVCLEVALRNDEFKVVADDVQLWQP